MTLTLAPPPPSRRPPQRLAALARQTRCSWPGDFTLLWAGTVTGQLGWRTAATATPLLALGFTDSPVFVGWLAAAGTIPGLLLYLPAGLVADRFDRWLIMRIAQLVRLLALGALVAGLALFPAPAVLLLVNAIIGGICSAFYDVAEVGAVTDVVSGDELGPAMAKSEARQHIALLSGRPLGGLLFGLHRVLPYAVSALTSLVSIATLLTIKARHNVQRQPRRTTQEEARGLGTALRTIVGDRFLFTTLAVCGGANFLFQTVNLLLLVMAHRQRLPVELYGVLLMSAGMGGLLGSMVASAVLRSVGPRVMVITAVALWIPMVLIVALSGQAMVGLVAWGSCSFMGAGINVALSNYLMIRVSKDLIGRVVGINRLLTGGAFSLGAMASGYLVSGLDPHGAATTVLALFVVLAAAATLLLMERDWAIALFVVVSHGPVSLGRHAAEWLPVLRRQRRRAAEVWTAIGELRLSTQSHALTGAYDAERVGVSGYVGPGKARERDPADPGHGPARQSGPVRHDAGEGAGASPVAEPV